MDRRKFLALTAAGALAGCGSDGAATDAPASESGDSGSGGSNTDASTPTAEQTPTATETPEQAKFVVEEFSVPDSVKVGEEHTVSLTVRNTGGREGTFSTRIESSTSNTVEWTDVGEVNIGPIEPGETVTEEGDPFSFDRAMTAQYRLPEYDTEVSYDVVLPQPEISTGPSSFVEVDTGYSTQRMAEVVVTNTGEGATGNFSITVDWYDGSSYLASSETYIETLGAGEIWVPRVGIPYDIEDKSAATDFEVNVGNVSGATSINPSGISVANDELLASDQQVLVRGDVENNRDTTVDYVEGLVKVKNSNGSIIGTRWTNWTDISPGGSVSFELEPDTNGRNGDVVSHDVVLIT